MPSSRRLVVPARNTNVLTLTMNGMQFDCML